MLGLDVSRAVVVGLGVTGVAAAEVLREVGTEVRVTEANDSPGLRETAARLRTAGIEVELGSHDPSVLESIGLVVPSKGVPPSNPILREAFARRIPVWSEFELAWKLGARSVIAVTGTNGKTTTTTLLSQLLHDAGISNIPSGNLPVPLVRAVSLHGEDALYVCEASSFGLAFIEDFRPFIGIVLNVGDDHYDWHEGYADYLAAKARITENQRESDLLVVNAADTGCLSIANGSVARLGAFALDNSTQIIPNAKSNWFGGISRSDLVVEKEDERRLTIPIADIRLQGRHNLENVLAAVIGAAEMGVARDSILGTLSKFEGLPHRVALVSEIRGVKYIDDSKATNPHATIRAFEGLDRVILIAGGKERDLDLSDLGSLGPKLVAVIAMGETAAKIQDLFSGQVNLTLAADVEDAVRIAAGIARPGETVLLSPACASLDQYSSYAERGERFAKAVMAL